MFGWVELRREQTLRRALVFREDRSVRRGGSGAGHAPCWTRGVSQRILDRFPFARSLVAAAFLMVGAIGCYAYAEPAYVEARAAPVEVYQYPRTYYEGRPVYLVNGRWYFVDRGRWHYYRSEPRPLYRERVYIEQAPAAPRRRYYEHYEAPRPSRGPPARQSAPPARRAR